MKKNQKKRLHRRLEKMTQSLGILLFCLALAAGAVTGSLWFLRPASSTVEKRTLSTFPAFTFGSFWDGSWFSQISTWYADTYPGRDSLIAMNQQMQQLYGLQPEKAVYGRTEAGDEIPDLPESAADLPDEEETQRNQERYSQIDPPDALHMDEAFQGQVMEGLTVVDGAAYGTYYFGQEAADYYIDMMNRTAKELKPYGTTVYSILVPNNSAVLLPGQDLGNGGSNEQQAIHYYYSRYSDLVHPVDTIDTLLQHNDEYLYFRTDHHWTSLATYYCYVNFCNEKGIPYKSIDQWESHTYEPFTGSYAAKLPGVDLIPDSVTRYVPSSVNTILQFTGDDQGNVFTTTNQPSVERAIFNTDEGYYGENGHYMRFIAGDLAFGMVDNPNINDGSSVLVLGESYDNSFIPWLVESYDKVYTADFRYNAGGIVSFCKENSVDDLIIMSNIQLIGNTSLVAQYDSVLN